MMLNFQNEPETIKSHLESSTKDQYEKIVEETKNRYIKYISQTQSMKDFIHYKVMISDKLTTLKQSENNYCLYEYLLILMDQQVLTKETITNLTEKSNLERSQVRDFFKNQRKRHILPISKKFVQDILFLKDQATELDGSASSYFERLCSGNIN